MKKDEIAYSIEHIFRDTERIHGKSAAIDWIKVASHKAASYLCSLKQDPSAMDQIREAFEPIQLVKESVPLTAEEIRNKFETESGVAPNNSQGEPDIEYVQWLENRLCEASQFQPKEIDLKKERAKMLKEFERFQERMKTESKGYSYYTFLDEYLNSK